MIDRATAERWIQRWDEQQETYAEHRDARFAAMTDLVVGATAERRRPVVVDLGAGPGSLAARLAAAVPRARVVAVESDPFLVALGRARYGGVVDLVAERAGSPGWRARLSLPEVDAVVASAALHYPSAERLEVLYADVLDWLAPGGVLVNGDHFADLAPGVAHRPEPDLEPWASWWRDAEAADELAALIALRSSAAAEEEGDGDNGLTASQHVALLRAAGFSSAEVAWQRGRSGVVVARR